ncbi:MAG: hypothetical protein Q3983_09295 [Capnocytophaga sp.]|nr:hypothetical protein [Capnocytophaga sp.]
MKYKKKYLHLLVFQSFLLKKSLNFYFKAYLNKFIMKKIYFILFLFTFYSTLIAQNTDFFEKLDYKDLIFNNKSYDFKIKVEKETKKVDFEGTFSISSNTYKVENLKLLQPTQIPEEEIKNLIEVIVKTSNSMYRSLYEHITKKNVKYNATYIEPNSWKLTFADDKTREKMKVAKNENCFFIITLNDKGYISQIKSTIENQREAVTNYETEKITEEDVKNLGGEIAGKLLENTLVSYFSHIKGEVINTKEKQKFYFELNHKKN